MIELGFPVLGELLRRCAGCGTWLVILDYRRVRLVEEQWRCWACCQED